MLEHRPLALAIAWDHRGRTMPGLIDLDDLRQEALAGLCEAAVAWNPTLSTGRTFCGFAKWRIHGRVIDALRAADPLTRAERIKIRSPRARDAIRLRRRTSLETPIADGLTLQDLIPGDGPPRLPDELPMHLLTQREREMVFLRFSADQTIETIGARYGVTASRVSQILAASLAKLRPEAIAT